jgi:acetyltransferase-like isoleucine patch superfamily enzyme
MKIIETVKKIISLYNKLIILVCCKNVQIKKTVLCLSIIKNVSNNHIKIFDTHISRSKIETIGLDNGVEILNSKVINADINIKGNGNKLLITDSNIYRMNIVLFGENCIISIEGHTIINGIRIVNVGKGNDIKIGKNCLFSDHIEIYGSDTHSIYDNKGNCVNPERGIAIGDNVWIGAHVKILKGVTIGEGAVVGMDSMVTKDIAPHTLVAGNPIKVIKENINWTIDYESIKNLNIYNL